MDKESSALISAAYARTLLDYLRGVGVDARRWYPTSDIAEIDSPDSHAQLPLTKWLAMFDTAIAATRDPDLPLKVGESVKARHFGLVGYVIMNSATVEEAFAQHQRFLKLVWHAARAHMVAKGSRTELHWIWTQGPTPPAMEQMNLASRINMIRWLTHRPDLKWDACFQMKRPRDTREYERIFGGTIRFGQRQTMLVIPTEHLRLAVVTSSPAARALAEEQVQGMLGALGITVDLVASLRMTLGRGLPAGHVSLQHAACALKMSTRTLRRRLDEQGCSFREILDEVRRSQAERLLRRSGASLAEVAFMLGYSQQSTFQQAFKRWTGKTPGEFRVRCAVGTSARKRAGNSR